MCEWYNVGVQRSHNKPKLRLEERSEVFSRELSYARHGVRGQECNRICLHEASCLEGMTKMHNRVINTVPGVEQHSCAMQHRKEGGVGLCIIKMTTFELNLKAWEGIHRAHGDDQGQLS